MRNLQSYQSAREVLGIWTSISRKCFLRLFYKLKSSLELVFLQNVAPK
jgi:hypothetical protein